MDEHVLIVDPSTDHILPIDGLKVQHWFNDLKKVIDSVNVGVENLHESLTKFTESLSITHDEKHWLPWDPLTTETDYRVRPIAIKKGGWGRCLRKLETTCTTCESQQDSAETM